MLSAVLCSCAGGAALLYALYRWIVPALAQHHAGLALIWHDVIVERLLDTLTRSTRPQVRAFIYLFLIYLLLFLLLFFLVSHDRLVDTTMLRTHVATLSSPWQISRFDRFCYATAAHICGGRASLTRQTLLSTGSAVTLMASLSLMSCWSLIRTLTC